MDTLEDRIMPTLGIRYRVDFTCDSEEDFEVCWAANELDATMVAKSVWGDDIVILKVGRCIVQQVP